MRKNQVVECILQLRRSAKRLSALRGLKKKNTRGQHPSSRSTNQRQTIVITQECLLRIYSSGRKALISLSEDKDRVATQFPTLVAADLIRKSTTEKRQMGDSHRTEGTIWGINPNGRPDLPPSNLLSYPKRSGTHTASPLDSDANCSSTNMDLDIESTPPSKLWDPIIGLSESEIDQWELEGLCFSETASFADYSLKRTVFSGIVHGLICNDGWKSLSSNMLSS